MNDNAASLNSSLFYVCRMESLNVDDEHVIQMLGYISLSKENKVYDSFTFESGCML